MVGKSLVSGIEVGYKKSSPDFDLAHFHGIREELSGEMKRSDFRSGRFQMKTLTGEGS